MTRKGLLDSGKESHACGVLGLEHLVQLLSVDSLDQITGDAAKIRGSS